MSPRSTETLGRGQEARTPCEDMKYKRSAPVSSCYLEMRAAKYANGQESCNLPIHLYYYLKWLQTLSLAAMKHPTGFGSRFTAYSSDSNKQGALSKLDTAVSRAEKAKAAFVNNKHPDAIEQWRLASTNNPNGTCPGCPAVEACQGLRTRW